MPRHQCEGPCYTLTPLAGLYYSDTSLLRSSPLSVVIQIYLKLTCKYTRAINCVMHILKQDRKGFWSTGASCKAIRDTSSALKGSPNPELGIAHCRLTSVKRQALINQATLLESPDRIAKKVIPRSVSS